jgi:iron complex transport system substrate-binding protein
MEKLNMRICSLLPSATEIVYALGLGDQLVGVSHACDYPPEARTKPVVSQSIRKISHLDSQEIDAIIQQARLTITPSTGLTATCSGSFNQT